MSSQTIQFLQAVRHGANPETIFQRAWEARSRTLEGHYQTTVQCLSDQQAHVENQVQPIVTKVASINIAASLESQAQLCQGALRDLQAVQTQMTAGLAQKNTQLQVYQQSVTILQKKITQLVPLLHQTPPSVGESFLLKLGQATVQTIGKK